jgi:hypothetical protein
VESVGTAEKIAGPAPFERVKIDGANYRAINTGDGYFTVLDVPIMSEVPEGIKGAPSAVGKEWLEKAVQIAQVEYRTGKFAGPCHIGHNRSLELADPEFAGFFLPRRVARCKVGGEEKWAVFADLKLKQHVFERALKGELPYISPEINDWESNKIDSVSFLSSKVPFFQFALFTIGDVYEDSMAKFEANLRSGAKFEDEPEEKKDRKSDGGSPAMEEPGDKKDSKGPACCSHCAMYGDYISRMAKMMGIAKEGVAMAEEAARPASAPVDAPKEEKKEPASAKMEAQYEGRLAALEEREKAREEEAKIAGLVSKAIVDLKGYALSDATKEKLAKFAKAGSDVLDAFVVAYKESVQKDPPRTLGEFESKAGVSASDPTLAKFSKSPEEMEAAMKALAEWKSLSKSRGFSVTSEEHLKFRVPEILAEKGR